MRALTIIGAVTLFLFTSCISDIDLTLNKDGRVVINGRIEFELQEPNEPLLQYVQIYYANGYYDNSNQRKFEENAKVVVSDGTDSWTLPYLNSGVYAKKFTLTPGKVYKLRVTIGSDVFTAQDSLRTPVKIKRGFILDLPSLVTGPGSGGLMGVFPTIEFADPEDEVNFYSIATYSDGKPNLTVLLFPTSYDDVSFSGRVQLSSFFDKKAVTADDRLSVKLFNVSEQLHHYEVNALERPNGNSFASVPPSNLRGNIVQEGKAADSQPYGFFRVLSSDSYSF